MPGQHFRCTKHFCCNLANSLNTTELLRITILKQSFCQSSDSTNNCILVAMHFEYECVSFGTQAVV